LQAKYENKNEETTVIELYYSHYSINSEKVLLCLFEKKLDFVGRHVDLLNFEQVDPAYLRINPLGLVPTLVVDGAAIPESTVINEYLEDAYRESPLLPAKALFRAEVRGLVQQFQDIFYPAMAVLSQVHLFAEELKRRWTPVELESLIRRKPNPDRRDRQLRAIRQGLSSQEISAAERTAAQMLDRMERHLSSGADWLAGGFSLADVAAAPNVHRFFILGLQQTVMQRPRVHEWYQHIRARSCFTRTYDYAPANLNTGRAPAYRQ
jgi:glutathione S-transferase